MKISAVMLTKNEQDTIDCTLQCLQHFDEIIAIDASIDNTPKILKEYNAKVITQQPQQFTTTEHPFHFGKAKNFAVQQATHDYVFLIDGDETIHRDIYFWLQEHKLDTVHIPQVHMKTTRLYYQLGGERARAGRKHCMIFDDSYNTNIKTEPTGTAPYALLNWGYAALNKRTAQRLFDSQHVHDGKGTWWEKFKVSTVNEMLQCFNEMPSKPLETLKTLKFPPTYTNPFFREVINFE